MKRGSTACSKPARSPRYANQNVPTAHSARLIAASSAGRITLLIRPDSSVPMIEPTALGTMMKPAMSGA